MPYTSRYNQFHWRERAAEARRIADLLSDSTARMHTMNCAESYDRLAEVALQQEIAAKKAANPS